MRPVELIVDNERMLEISQPLIFYILTQSDGSCFTHFPVPDARSLRQIRVVFSIILLAPAGHGCVVMVPIAFLGHVNPSVSLKSAPWTKDKDILGCTHARPCWCLVGKVSWCFVERKTPARLDVPWTSSSALIHILCTLLKLACAGNQISLS